MWINWLVFSALLHQSVYSHFFLRFWTNDVTNFPKVTWVISPPICHLRFSMFVLELFLIQEERIGNVFSTSHWIRPVLWSQRSPIRIPPMPGHRYVEEISSEVMYVIHMPPPSGNKVPTVVLKPRADVTWSPKQGPKQWPHKKDSCSPN